MRFRKLRIAWSATCLIVCVLLIALWVRSYWWIDSAYVRVRGQREFYVGEFRGLLNLMTKNLQGAVGSPAGGDWITRHEPAVNTPLYLFGRSDVGAAVFPKFFYNTSADFGTNIGVPIWSALLMAASVAALPWIPWSVHFSLRTLLIATTLAALVLGAVVWAVR
jgi:hypothetical protein